MAQVRNTRSPGAPDRAAPHRPALVLISLILVAAVANLNLAVANVALPDIGQAFDASQAALDLVAVAYSLGLAASVLYLGALGDHHGRKGMLVAGTLLAVPACLLAAYAPSAEVLIAARLLGGLAAGMAFPTTLALITALWAGAGRTRAIALWSAGGGAISALGPLTAGALLLDFWWGSVFLVTLPLAAVALVMALAFVPGHVHETTEPVDSIGGVLSVVMVGALILAINFAPVPDRGGLAIGLAGVAVGVAALVWSWAVAQSPYLLPFTLTIAEGAGAAATMRWLLIWAAAAALLVMPALFLLYLLDQRGELEEDPATSAPASPVPGDARRRRSRHAGGVAHRR